MGDGLRRSSALLLKGWKMLSTPCPICSNAIFSKDGAMQCPYCDLPIRVDDGHEEVLQSDNVDQQEDIEDIRSFDDLQQSYENRRKQSDLASAAIGKKLLQGWTMLAEHCPVENCCFAPLMRPEETGPMICPVCECTYELSGDGDVVSTSMPPTKEVSEVEGIAQAPKEKSMESNSAAISSLLLKGWAMLSSTCSCGNNAPLMRDKCGKVFCIDCGCVDDKDRQQPTQANVPPSAPPHPKESVPVCSASTLSGDRDKIVASFHALEQRLYCAAKQVEGEADVKVACDQVELIRRIAVALQEISKIPA